MFHIPSFACDVNVSAVADMLRSVPCRVPTLELFRMSIRWPLDEIAQLWQQSLKRCFKSRGTLWFSALKIPRQLSPFQFQFGRHVFITHHSLSLFVYTADQLSLGYKQTWMSDRLTAKLQKEFLREDLTNCIVFMEFKSTGSQRTW